MRHPQEAVQGIRRHCLPLLQLFEGASFVSSRAGSCLHAILKVQDYFKHSVPNAAGSGSKACQPVVYVEGSARSEVRHQPQQCPTFRLHGGSACQRAMPMGPLPMSRLFHGPQRAMYATYKEQLLSPSLSIHRQN